MRIPKPYECPVVKVIYPVSTFKFVLEQKNKTKMQTMTNATGFATCKLAYTLNKKKVGLS